MQLILADEARTKQPTDIDTFADVFNSNVKDAINKKETSISIALNSNEKTRVKKFGYCITTLVPGNITDLCKVSWAGLPNHKILETVNYWEKLLNNIKLNLNEAVPEEVSDNFNEIKKLRTQIITQINIIKDKII
jgi:hypothetical protein